MKTNRPYSNDYSKYSDLEIGSWAAHCKMMIRGCKHAGPEGAVVCFETELEVITEEQNRRRV